MSQSVSRLGSEVLSTPVTVKLWVGESVPPLLPLPSLGDIP